MVFLHGEKERLKAKNVKIFMPDLSRVAAEHWKVMPEESKRPFIEEVEKLKEKYEADMKKYRLQMKEFEQKYPISDDKFDVDEPLLKKQRPGFVNLFNKIVKLTEEGKRQAGDEFQYYYVLTYIPDLFWCHLAPLRKAGVFGPNRKKSEGRTKWMLVDEGEGKELDITGAVCQVVKSRTIRGCADADTEEWDIIDDDEAITCQADIGKTQGDEEISEEKSSEQFRNDLLIGCDGSTAECDSGAVSVTANVSVGSETESSQHCDSNNRTEIPDLTDADTTANRVDQDFKENSEPRKQRFLDKVIRPRRSSWNHEDDSNGVPQKKTVQTSLLSFLGL
jgi:hypothetical protein